MTYVFASLEDLAKYFDEKAAIERQAETHAKRKDDKALARGEAYAYENAAHVVRNTIIKEQKVDVLDPALQLKSNAWENIPDA